MKRTIILTSFVLAAMLPLSASAQPGPGMGGMGGMGGTRPDCSKAADPGACQARQEARRAQHEHAREQCKEKAGRERRECMRDAMMAAEDCAKAPSPERCEARKQAHADCKDKAGPAMKQCLHERMPQPDCSKAKDPQRCERHLQARAACKDRQDKRACMREQQPPVK